MTDIRLLQYTQFVPYDLVADWLLTPIGGLDQSNELATAFIVALATDGLASTSDFLPGLDDDDRRGWWGDQDAKLIWGAWPIGSRLWLLERDKITDSASQRGDTLAQAEALTQQCLRPFLDNRVVSRIEITARRPNDRRDTIVVRVVAYRGPEVAVALQFDALWDGIRN